MLTVLKVNRRMLRFIGLELKPNERTSSTIDKLKIAVLVSLMISYMGPCAAYFFKYKSDFLKSMEAFYTFVVFNMFLLIYLIFIHRKSDIRQLVAHLESIVNQSE